MGMEDLDIYSLVTFKIIQLNFVPVLSVHKQIKIKDAYAIRDKPPMFDTDPRVVGVASLSWPHTPHIRPRAISTTINSRIQVSATPAIQLK